MAGYRKRNTEGPNSEDKALDLFAEMMIEKIESIQKDWHKPWFTEGVLQWPRNLSGREYNGMNALMLLLHCENEGYKIPRFCTFDCVQRLNKPGKDGQELPRVSVLKGEKSFPVMLTTFTCIHKETKEKSSMTITRSSPTRRRRNTTSIPNAGVPGVQCRPDQLAGGTTGVVGAVGGREREKDRKRRTFQFRARRYDDSG